MTKLAENCGFRQFTKEILNGKLQCFSPMFFNSFEKNIGFATAKILFLEVFLWINFCNCKRIFAFFSLLDKDSIYKICILSGLFCCFDLLYLEIFTWFSERRQWPWCCISRLFQFLLSGFVCCCLLDTVSLEFLFVPLVIWCGLKIFFFFNCLQFFGLWASCTCFIQM